MKKFRRLFLAALLVLAALILMPACGLIGGSGSGSGSGSSKGGVTGCYVRTTAMGIDDYDYFILDKSGYVWENAAGESGEFRQSGSELTLSSNGKTYAVAAYSGSGKTGSFTYEKEGERFEYTCQSTTPEPPKRHTSNSVCYVYMEAEGASGFDSYKEAAGGRTTTLKPAMKSGYTFLYWQDRDTGKIYISDVTVLPYRAIKLIAVWEEISPAQSGVFADEFVEINYGGCAKKVKDVSDEQEFYKELDRYTKYTNILRVELSSADLGGEEKVGEKNNFCIKDDLKGLTYTARAGYSMYGFEEAQRSLDYGHNLLSFRMSAGQSYRSYLLDVYVKRDYRVKVYDGYSEKESESFTTLTVVEGDLLPDAAAKEITGFVFDKFCLCADDSDYDCSMPVTDHLSLYQTYLPVSVSADAAGGELTGEIKIEPYKKGFLEDAVPTREGHTFVGWEGEEGIYIGNNGRQFVTLTAENRFSSLTAVWDANKYVKSLWQYQLRDYYTLYPITCKVEYYPAVYGEDRDYRAHIEYYHNSIVSLSELDYYEYGDTVVLTSECPEYAFSFAGWFGNDGRVDEGEEYADLEFEITAQTGYYAEWTYYTVTLSVDEALHGEAALAGGKTPVRGSYTVPLEEGHTAVEAGTEATLVATTNRGYTFLGWFAGTEKLSEKETYLFTMAAKNLAVEARWQLQPELEGFLFTSDATSCTLKGVEVKTVTSLTIPEVFTKYSLGALRSLTELRELTLPFVGADAENGGNLGYLFGASQYKLNACIPATLTKVTVTGSLSAEAFRNCGNLTQIILPEELEELPAGTFYDCAALETVDLPNTVTAIGENAFYGTAITELNLPAGITELTTRMLAGMPFTSYTVSAAITKIGSYAFQNCAVLEELIIPDTVQSIGSYAFSGCDALPTVELPSAMTAIPTGVFGGYTGLSHFEVRDGVTEIGDSAFQDCANLERVTIAKTVTTIGRRAFYGCTLLDEITFLRDSGTNKCALARIADEAFAHTAITSFSYPNTNALTLGKDLFAGGKIETLSIKSGINAIPDSAFSKVTTLKTVELFGISTVGESAFEGCTALTTVTASPEFSTVEKRAFYGCNKLNSITLQYVSTIRDYAFSGCSSLSYVNLNGVSFIGEYAFSDTRIKNVSLPTSLQTIKRYAFPDLTGATFSTLSGGGYHAYRIVVESTNYVYSNSWRPIGVNAVYDTPAKAAAENARILNLYRNATFLCID